MPTHIRLITPITTPTFRTPAELKSMEAPDIRISHAILEEGPPSIESEYDEALAIAGVVRRVREAERDGADAVVIDCMGDPGLRASREAVTIPVVGPSEASMHVAAMLGWRFSVVTVLSSVVPMFENSAQLAGLSARLASVRVIDIPVLELGRDLNRLHDALIEESLQAVRHDNADVIIFGCTGMLGCVDAVSEGLRAHSVRVPVIDPVPTAVRLAQTLVTCRLAHSKRRFPTPTRVSAQRP